MEKTERTKAEILDGLLEKIQEGEDALQSAQRERDVLAEAVARRTRDDALLGQEAYSQAARREDGKVLRDLENDLGQLTASLETLRHTLPSAKRDAAHEQLEAVSRGLAGLDQDHLGPALEVFRGAWNRMLGGLAEIEQVYRDRGVLEGEFGAARESLPVGERSVLFPPAPSLSHAAFRNLLVWRGVDPPRFFKGLDRFQIQESDLRGQDRAPVLTIAPDAAAAPETEN